MPSQDTEYWILRGTLDRLGTRSICFEPTPNRGPWEWATKLQQSTDDEPSDDNFKLESQGRRYFANTTSVLFCLAHFFFLFFLF